LQHYGAHAHPAQDEFDQLNGTLVATGRILTGSRQSLPDFCRSLMEERGGGRHDLSQVRAEHTAHIQRSE